MGGDVFFFAPQLISIFTSDPEVAPYGIRCLRIVSAGFVFYGFGMVLTQSFNGAGDTRTPTIIHLVCLWLWELPLAWTLAHRGRPRADRCLHRRQRRVLDARRCERMALSQGNVEDGQGLSGSVPDAQCQAP